MKTVFLTLLNMSITAGWLVLAVMLFRILFKKAPKSLTLVMWALVGLRLICPFSVESVFSLIPTAQVVPMETVPMPTVSVSPLPPTTAGSEAVATQAIEWTSIFAAAASVVWLIGMLAMAIYMLVHTLRLRYRLREAVCLHDNVWVCDHVTTPFVLGLIRPRIYLPSSMNEADRHYVILHEQMHLKRADHWWKLLGFVLLCVYWFQPLLWIAYILFSRDIEYACDENVIRHMEADSKKQYSNVLISYSAPRKVAVMYPVGFGEIAVKKRIRSILSYRKPTLWICIAAVVLCVVIGLCFLTDPVSDPSEQAASANPLQTTGTTVPTDKTDIFGGASTTVLPTSTTQVTTRTNAETSTTTATTFVTTAASSKVHVAVTTLPPAPTTGAPVTTTPTTAGTTTAITTTTADRVIRSMNMSITPNPVKAGDAITLQLTVDSKRPVKKVSVALYRDMHSTLAYDRVPMTLVQENGTQSVYIGTYTVAADAPTVEWRVSTVVSIKGEELENSDEMYIASDSFTVVAP